MESSDCNRPKTGRWAAGFLILVALVVSVLVVMGALLGRGAVTHDPTSLETVVRQLRSGSEAGLWGLAVALVLVGPPCGMLIASAEIRKDYGKALWVALATIGIFGLSILLAILS